MPCADCPKPRGVPGGQTIDPELTGSALHAPSSPGAGAGAARVAAAGGDLDTPLPLLPGTVLLPTGAPIIKLRVDKDRIRQGLPAIIIHTGKDAAATFVATAVTLHGPSTLGLTDDDQSYSLRTSAAIEVLA